MPKMVENAQKLHRSDLNSIEFLFFPLFTRPSGQRKTTFEMEKELFETIEEFWDTKEGTQNRY